MEVVRSSGDRPVEDAAQVDGGEVGASCDPESNGEGETGRGGSSGGARYKLMSPAKLPISRSPCLTIPPGLSPSSFLESPVLLSNVKAEPSPTTGSFFKPQMVHGYGGSTLFSTIINNSVAMDGSKSSCFEFQTTSGSNPAACLFVARPLASADTHNQQSNQGMQVQAQSSHHSFASSATTRGDGVASSNELSLSAPSPKDVPNGSMQTDCDESNQKLLPGDEVQVPRADHCGVTIATNERASDDGYNWRKYGQKLVKGSEHPRSYYKCTHPNCEVKKLFERAPDGQIAEIVYKGTHDHPKPQLNRRLSTGSTMSIQEERSEKFSSHTGLEDKAPTFSGQMTQNKDPTATAEPSHLVANDNNLEVGLSQLNKIPEDDDNEDDDPFAKRRKTEISGMDINSVIKPICEPRVVVQTLSEVDILDDGYRWRKYGQKVVRGNPNPRSYYKCTSVGCPVRKHVERASHDPKAVITTYEGKHNHDVPTARTNNHDAAATVASMASRPRPQEGDTVSLDLGVGISSGADNTPDEPAQGQPRILNSNLMYLHPVAMSAYPGFVNGTVMMMHGAAESRVEGNPPLSRSTNPYSQSIGRLLMGP